MEKVKCLAKWQNTAVKQKQMKEEPKMDSTSYAHMRWKRKISHIRSS